MILIDVPVPGQWDSQVYAFTRDPETIRADIMARIPSPQNKQALQVYDQGLEEKKQRQARYDKLAQELTQ